jgi:hypothetical protein
MREKENGREDKRHRRTVNGLLLEDPFEVITNWY